MDMINASLSALGHRVPAKRSNGEVLKGVNNNVMEAVASADAAAAAAAVAGGAIKQAIAAAAAAAGQPNLR